MPARAQQGAASPEFWVLQRVVNKAVQKARKSVVTVETFGGPRGVGEVLGFRLECMDGRTGIPGVEPHRRDADVGAGVDEHLNTI